MCEWQRLRTRLNHDWLKNEYLKGLDGLILQLQASRTVDSVLSGYMREYLRDWAKRHDDVERLLTAAEDRLSPRNLLEKEPLIHCSSEHKAWLAPLIHGLWLVRNRIRERIEDARKILSEADELHTLLQRNETEPSHNMDVDCTVEFLESFADSIKKLTRVISEFPDKVVAA